MFKVCMKCHNIVPFTTVNGMMRFECLACHVVTPTTDDDLCIESNFRPKDHESKRVLLSAEDPAHYLEAKPCTKCNLPYRAVTLTPDLIAFLVCPNCKLVEYYQ